MKREFPPDLNLRWYSPENFVGPPDATTSFPQTMLVDWDRVDQFK